MDLVDDREHPFGVETELVLGVDEHQTRLGGDLLSPFEDLKRNGARLIPQLGVDDAMFDDLEFCDRFVVAALFGFGCGGDDRLGQWVVLLHPIGEVEPVDRAGTSVVLRPQRGRVEPDSRPRTTTSTGRVSHFFPIVTLASGTDTTCDGTRSAICSNHQAASSFST